MHWRLNCDIIFIVCYLLWSIISRYKRKLSTKQACRIKRTKTSSRIFNLSLSQPLPPQSVLLGVTINKEQLVDLIVEDLIAHKGDLVNNPLILTGPDPVPVEIRGPSRDSLHGQVIPRPDLRTTHEEADNRNKLKFRIALHASLEVSITPFIHDSLAF